MKKSLISKLIFIPAIIFSLNASLKAQKQNDSKIGLYPKIDLEIGVSNYNNYQNELIPPMDWKERFKPENKDMKLKEKYFFPKADFSVGLEPTLKKENFEISLPIYLHYSNFFPASANKLVVDWWNPVKVQDVAFRKQTPSFGVSASIKTKYDSKISFQIFTHKYLIMKRDFEGIDIEGGKNRSRVVNKNILEKNLWAQKASISFSKAESAGSIGIYFEKANKYFNAGFNYSIDLSESLK